MGLRFRGKVRGDLLRAFSTSSIWYDSGTKSESNLCFCCAYAEPNCNLARRGRSTTSAMGLNMSEKEKEKARPTENKVKQSKYNKTTRELFSKF